MRVLGGIFLSVITLAPGVAWSQVVVPDGTSATSVVRGTSGKSTVTIAPVSSRGVSLNRFSRFNVPKAGVDLDNRAASARTIVNEVTGSGRTAITGDLSVLGSQAHVIVANPNGISVNGGRFRNTGNVSLATGAVTLDTQGRPRVSVSSGSINIGDQGLTGTMTQLDLLSKRLRIDGAVRGQGSSLAHVNVQTGEGVTSYDTGLVPGSDGTWSTTVASNGASAAGISVDVSSRALLNAGRITIQVTDAGAGVRSAGRLVGTSGNINVSANGEVEFSGDVTAREEVNVSGTRLAIVGTSKKAATVQSEDNGVVLESFTSGITLAGATIAGRQRNFSSFASTGAITVISAGDIDVHAVGKQPASFASTLESISLLAEGNYIGTGSTFTSTQDVNIGVGGNFTSRNETMDVDRDAQVVATGRVCPAPYDWATFLSFLKIVSGTGGRMPRAWCGRI